MPKATMSSEHLWLQLSMDPDSLGLGESKSLLPMMQKFDLMALEEKGC